MLIETQKDGPFFFGAEAAKTMKRYEFRTGGEILYIPTSYIRENPLRPRIYFNREELCALCDSISAFGILEPLTVCYNADDSYIVISGERRLRAARMLGMEELPCVLTEFDVRKASFVCLAQNTRRRELHYFETAMFLERLHDDFGYSYWELSQKTGYQVQEIYNKVRLLAIPVSMRKAIIENGLTERFARLLLRHNSDEAKNTLLRMIVSERLTLSEAKERSAALLRGQRPQKSVYLKFFKDLTVFVNTIDHAVDTMVESGISATNEKTDAEDYLEYRIRIPK